MILDMMPGPAFQLYIAFFFLVCKVLGAVKWNLQTLSFGLCCLLIVSALNDVERG